MITHRAEHPGGRREKASRTAPGRNALQKNPTTSGQFKKYTWSKWTKIRFVVKKEVPCIIMPFRAMGRRLLVERTRELPQMRTNQSGSLEMSATWLPPLFYTHTHARAHSRGSSDPKRVRRLQFNSVLCHSVLWFISFSCSNYSTLNILMCLFNLI